MRGFSLFVLAIGLLVLQLAPAQAQATRTWVSGVGDDANPCSRTAPCKTFAGAISKTAAKGEINCLDPGGFGALTITKAITIACEGVTAGVLTNAANAINVSAGVNDAIHLKGLFINGLDTAANGIKINSGRTVLIEDCHIQGFATFGIANTSSTANSIFVVSRTTLKSNGAGATGGAIQVKPSQIVTGTIDRIIAIENGAGVVADTTSGAPAINLTVRDSSFHRNTVAGLSATTSSGAIGIMAMRNSVVSSGLAFTTSGPNATIRVGESLITGNGSAALGAVFSFGTNQIAGNGNDNIALIPAPALK